MRPLVSLDIYLNEGGKGLLNPKAFTPNPLGTFGTSHYGAFGPTQVNFDSALSRVFPLRERFSLEMRLEAFRPSMFSITPTSPRTATLLWRKPGLRLL
jgi:hypothetical protein